MDFNVIFVAGPQGCGKGTQGKRLAQKLGFFFWGMGGTLRKIAETDTPLAKKIAPSLVDGSLLDDQTIIEVLESQLPEIPAGQGIVFDGVPRRIGQAEFLIPYLRAHGHEKMATIFIDLPREESMKRLVIRAKNEDRRDDTPEGIENRFRFYDEFIKPTEEYLKKETTFIEVDGRPGVEEISAEINKALGLG